MNEAVLSQKSKAVLFEINEALKRFTLTGETWSVFINKMSLTDDERQEIRDFLGLGSITVHLSDTAEPAEWMESGIAGIWYGVFYDQTKNPILETIEIGNYPQVASAQIEDINIGLQKLTLKLA
ncbi:hydrogenase expression/formation C-terminal domain-containing protein [Pelosinus sp. IPA-1]|uniref:hydrogenase expression/formation C-terminal domain-containing protein n=1 Tax=Pelosinus sp. IPA-1 TaxID=3029569 RepID=UPI002436283C|nr:hydrogenase expression/formation C-terminal domain-containing protein [Pelosinus sp. IPA-1]GMB00851.1 hydrogenase expression/formation protein [Pelosinus sp. IPA-1]